MDGGYIYIVAPLKTSEIHLVLQDKNKIEKMHPELNLGTLSIMMQTDDIERVHKHFIKHGINTNPITELPGFKFFNFSDNENNYFAIQEKK